MFPVPPRQTKGAANLRRAKGYLDGGGGDPNLIAGWILVPDQELSSVQIYANGARLGSTEIVLRPDLGVAYPRIPHAARSGFALRVRPGQLSATGINRISVVGCRGGRPIARMDAFSFQQHLVPPIPTPPPEIMKKIQCGLEGQLYRTLGFQYYVQLRDAISRNRDWRSVRCLLDWGCGTGRVAANFLAAPDGPKVLGCDIDPEVVAWCREHLPAGQFADSDSLPPLPYPDCTFDVIISLAVLASFGAEAYQRWLPELKRVLAPGGLFLGSVQGSFAASFELPSDTLAAIRLEGILDPGVSYSRETHRATEEEWRGYFLTREYVEREWPDYFEIVEYLEGEINSDQDLVVVRRTA
jgi:SAM-dependent methyltransferase